MAKQEASNNGNGRKWQWAIGVTLPIVGAVFGAGGTKAVMQSGIAANQAANEKQDECIERNIQKIQSLEVGLGRIDERLIAIQKLLERDDGR